MSLHRGLCPPKRSCVAAVSTIEELCALKPPVRMAKRKKALALDSLHATASCFDRLFGHIAPVISQISSNTLIDETLLSTASIEWIQHLSRAIFTTITLVNELEEESITVLEDVKHLREKLAEEQKRVHVLQDFLVNELANSDSLATEVRSLKESLSSTIKQRDNYKEKCDSQIEELRMLAAKSVPTDSVDAKGDAASAILAQSLLGKYIKKTFKGHGVFYAVVVGYLKPYYKLVYEDGDSEEMTRDEVLAALCTDEEISSLSPSLTTAISQISEEFDSKNPEACFRGMLSNRPTGEDFPTSSSPSSSSAVRVKSECYEDRNEEEGEEEEEGEDHDLRGNDDEDPEPLSRHNGYRIQSNGRGRPRNSLGDNAEESGNKRRRKKSCPFLPTTRKRKSRSNSQVTASPSISSTVSTPIKRPRGRRKKERSDSISESVVSVVSIVSVSGTSVSNAALSNGEISPSPEKMSPSLERFTPLSSEKISSSPPSSSAERISSSPQRSPSPVKILPSYEKVSSSPQRITPSAEMISPEKMSSESPCPVKVSPSEISPSSEASVVNISNDFEPPDVASFEMSCVLECQGEEEEVSQGRELDGKEREQEGQSAAARLASEVAARGTAIESQSEAEVEVQSETGE